MQPIMQYASKAAGSEAQDTRWQGCRAADALVSPRVYGVGLLVITQSAWQHIEAAGPSSAPCR